MSTNNLSIVQSPVNAADKVPVITNWNPMIGFMIYKDENISSLFFYKIALSVYLGSNTSYPLLAMYKQRRNGYSVDVSSGKARAFFDIRDVVNTQIVDTVFDQNLDGIPFSTIHKLGANTYESGGSVAYRIFSLNGDRNTSQTQIVQIYVRAFDCYATSTASAVTCYSPSTPVSNTSFYMQGALNLFQARSTTAAGGVDTDYIQGVAMQLYCLNGASKLFLSDVEASSYVDPFGIGTRLNYIYWDADSQVGDYHTVAFLNGETDFDSKPVKMEIKYYNSSDSVLSTSYITNAAAIGGAIPLTSGTEVDENRERIVYFGAGPGNLFGFTDSSNGNSTTHKPSNAINNGWSYYTVKAVDGSNNATSAIYAFKKMDKSCKGYTMRRLAWRNSKGAYDYLNFELKSTDTIDITRNKYEKVIGIFNKSKYRYSNWDKGQAVRETSAIRKETLNTGYLDAEQASLVKECLLSTDVYVVQNVNTGITQSVIVTDSSYVKKTVANDKLIQYTVNIEYSNNVNTNS